MDADREHHQHAEVGQGGERRVEGGADPAGPDVGVAQLVGLGGEPVGLLALAAEGLDDHRAVEGLVGDLADLGAEPLGPGRPAGGEALVDEVGDDDRREDEQPDHRQHDVGGSIWTTAITIITSVPTAIGSGAIGPQAASTSE